MTPRSFLARELQRAREAKSLTPEALARTLFVSESLIRSWEKGRRLPRPDTLTHAERVLGTGGILTRLLADLVDAAVPIEWFGPWKEIEQHTSAFWSFEPLIIPGHLQTPDYARAVLKSGNHAADLDEMVDDRMKRQLPLADEDGPMLVCLIAECALRHMVGDPAVMHAQCVRLAEHTARENVIVHLVPETAAVCAEFVSGFMLADSRMGQFAYVDNQLTGDVIDRPEDIARLRRTFDIIRADALSREESAAQIARTVQKWKARSGADLPTQAQTAATA